ncbi:energy transducer TonB [Flavobacterium cheniae]|jgi:protein TonB|uniref:Outer membrane transport energization protein TonB (TC 2.C.1.1.1) n=1 Tax=Flavobacterium cheniae TaxID=295428 RepID=A0A562KLP6_9FLAO|nr:energy transducer TonB [Flavobacterium cheniae]TDR24186.1 outer membrane transport energization protein TonB [Flavobacterium cheniae]TWH96306.1 outer membrane transport energization protein TonB (TC 2.C.1.1.1) [Flavobacterium cheniae]
MEVKKNPSVDPKRNSSLYFLVGLTAVLMLTYVSIELKSEDPRVEVEKLEIADNMMGEDEEVILTMPPVQKLPPPPPPAPEVIQIVDNKQVIEDKKIETTEVDENKAVVVNTASSYGEEGGTAEEIDEEVPFAVIEDVPVFPGCEGVAKNKRLDCFMEQMAKHIKKNQQYPERAMEDGIQGRVSVLFVIDKDGGISNVQVRGPKGGELLEKEAKRVIEKLPKFKPGMQRGKPVKVKYSQPITFKLQ